MFNRRLVTLSLYAVAYILVAMVTVFGIPAFYDMFVADPIPTAAGIALSIVFGLRMTDGHLRPKSIPPTK